MSEGRSVFGRGVIFQRYEPMERTIVRRESTEETATDEKAVA